MVSFNILFVSLLTAAVFSSPTPSPGRRSSKNIRNRNTKNTRNNHPGPVANTGTDAGTDAGTTVGSTTGTTGIINDKPDENTISNTIGKFDEQNIGNADDKNNRKTDVKTIAHNNGNGNVNNNDNNNINVNNNDNNNINVNNNVPPTKPVDPATPQITYHGGAIMSENTQVHILYYGQITGKTLLEYFVSNLQESHWWSYTKQYKDNSGNTAGTTISLGTVKSMNVSSTTLNDGDVEKYIAQAFGSNSLSKNGIYMMLSDQTVTTSDGFCSNYCGWHSSRNNIKYIFVGSPLNCNGCKSIRSVDKSPNGYLEMDNMITTIAHELTETVTNPTGSGWYVTDGLENADLCNRKYGDVASDGANQLIGQKRFLIQQNWVLYPQQGCAS